MGTTRLDISAGNLERIITGPIIRQKGNTVIQQIADLLGQDRSDVCACTKIGEELAKVCGKKRTKLKITAERVEGVLVRVAPVERPQSKVAPNKSTPLLNLSDEINDRQRWQRQNEGDPQTSSQWEKLMTSNRHHALSHHDPGRITL